MFLKTLFFEVRWTFPKRIFFVFEFSNHYCRKLNKNLRTFWTKTSPVCQISILHLNLFSWRKNNLGNGKIVCFSYFKQKGITDLGRNVFEFSLYNDIEKISAGLFQCCFFVITFRFWNKSFQSFDTKFSAVDQNCTKRVHGKI